MLYPETSAASTNDQDGKSTDILPLDVLKKTIKSIATRTNWGIRDAASVDLDLDPKSDSYILPAGLTIWAWEVQDRDLVVEDLTVDMANKVEARYKEREQVHADAIALLKALPRDERAALFTKGSKKASAVKSTQKSDTTGGSTTEPIEINSETKSKTSEQQTKARPKAKQSDPEVRSAITQLSNC